jgi:hypothetical protein
VSPTLYTPNAGVSRDSTRRPQVHPAINHDLAQAHVADLRHRAQRDTLARAVRLARRSQPEPALLRLAAWGGQRRRRPVWR